MVIDRVSCFLSACEAGLVCCWNAVCLVADGNSCEAFAAGVLAPLSERLLCLPR